MVSGWRRVFCTSVPKEELKFEKQPYDEENSALYSPVITSRFNFFFKQAANDTTSSPALRCKTAANHTPTASIPNSPKSYMQATPSGLNSPMLLFQRYFSPRGCVNKFSLSPRSPFGLSLIKSTLRLSRSKCGICGENVRGSDGGDAFTAECRHVFHSKCLSSYMKTIIHGSKIEIPRCPVCLSEWKDPRILPFISSGHRTPEWRDNSRTEDNSKKHFRIYNDDEPLLSPSPASLIPSIPENDGAEEEECNVFQSREETPGRSSYPPEIAILPQSAIISASRTHETRAVVLKLKAPRLSETSQHLPIRHAPVDIVALLELSDRSSVTRIKFAMATIVSSLSPSDRLSIVAFSNVSKRLLSLRRMTSQGKRAVRRVVDALMPSGHGMSVNDALKKAAKVIGDRRERNPSASIVVINPTANVAQGLTTTRLPDHQIAIHWLSAGDNADVLSKSVHTILNAAFHDVTLQLRLPALYHGVVTAIYPLRDRPSVHPPENVCLGILHSGEERELLTEVKIPRQSNGERQQLCVRVSYRDASSNHSWREQTFVLPQAYGVRSNVEGIERLRNVYVMTKAIAESRRLAAGGETEAYELLASARGLVSQSGDVSGGDCLRHLDAEIEKLQIRWKQPRVVADKDELATPTSAWRAAERLAKVAIMRKHMTRVSDLHGFENARF